MTEDKAGSVRDMAGVNTGMESHSWYLYRDEDRGVSYTRHYVKNRLVRSMGQAVRARFA